MIYDELPLLQIRLDSLINKIRVVDDPDKQDIIDDSPELSYTQIHERLLEIKKYIEESK